MLRLRTFGGCFLERDGARIDTASAHRKGLALLAVTAAAGERGVSRDAALALLWPESDDTRARTSLRQLVHLLRNLLQAPDLLETTPELRLNAAVVTSDIGEFAAALAADDLSTAAELYRGPFLDGFYISGAEELERWIATERASLARAAARAVETLAQGAEERGELRAAMAWWRRLTELEPISAQAAIGLMRCLDATGERAAALRHARVHELLVEDELGAAPDSAVAAFAETLRTRAPLGDIAAAPVPAHSDVTVQGAAARHAAPTVRPRRRTAAVAALLALLIAITGFVLGSGPRGDVDTSLAVLPLANTSGQADNDVVSDGLTENLIASLAVIPDVRVIGRTSAFRFRERPLDVRAIADSLGVSAVLDGSVQRAGDALKISVQLVNAADATVIWAETYDRQLSDFFAIQDEITRAIVAALRLRLAHDATPSPALRDARAYELYLRGRHIFTMRTDPVGIERARHYFEEALARDTLLAQAHAGLSDVHARLAIFGYVPSGAGFTRAKMHAQRALELDSTLAEAWASLGHAQCVADFDWDAAERSFERAIALNPNYQFGRMPYSICLMGRGRFREAERHLLAARASDPLSPAPSNLLGRLYVYMQQPDRAIEHLLHALELSPQMDLAWQQLGHAYLQKHQAAEAIGAFQRAAALSGARDSAHLAYAYAVFGRTDQARRIITAVTPPQPDSRMAFHLALAYTGLRDFDRAIEWLEHGIEAHGSFSVGLYVDPAIAPLRSHPRWPALLRRLRLE